MKTFFGVRIREASQCTVSLSLSLSLCPCVGGLDHGAIGLVVSAGLVATLVILLSGVVAYMVSYRVRRGRSYSEL